MTDNKSKDLVEAVKNSDANMTKILLADGANPNCRTASERTLLELAIMNNDMETFKLLVESGANIMARGRDGCSMLYNALRCGNMDAAKYLIARWKKNGVNQEIHTMVLLKAIKEKDRELVKLLLDAGADVNSESEHLTPLIAAIKDSDMDTLKLLVEHGADTNLSDIHYKPLMYALKKKNTGIATYLLEHGAEPNCGEEYENPLSIAAEQDNVEMLSLLLDKGAKMDAHDSFEASFRRIKRSAGPKVAAFLDDEYLKKYRPGDHKRFKFEAQKITDTKFENVIGMERVKSELRRDILYHLKHAELAKEFGLTLKGGILLFGPPGCGKTFITKALAGESGVNFIEASVSDIYDKWVGSEGKAMRSLFNKARKSAPCILFFDEMELIGGNREMTGNHVWAREALNVFLSEMDGATNNNEGLLVIGATNAPWMVDAALKRNGRLGKFIYIPPPDRETREGLFRMYLGNRPVAEDIDYAKLADISGDCNAADIPAICNEAAKLAWEDSIVSGTKRKISMEDMNRSFSKETYNMNEWFQNVRQHMATEVDKKLYSELNESLQKMEAHTASTYR